MTSTTTPIAESERELEVDVRVDDRERVRALADHRGDRETRALEPRLVRFVGDAQEACEIEHARGIGVGEANARFVSVHGRPLFGFARRR